jgi:hypothetical protein
MVLAAASSSSVAELSSSHSVTSSRFNSPAVRSERGPERSQLSFSICSFRANDHHRPSGDLWPRGYLQPSDVIPSRMEQG